MYTGIKELIADRAQESPEALAAGLQEDAVYRADVVYDRVEHDQFVVVRFGDPTSRMGKNHVTPYEILGYCGTGSSDRMKKIMAAIVATLVSLSPEKTESGMFMTTEDLGPGRDMFDVGYSSMVLVNKMRSVGSGY